MHFPNYFVSTFYDNSSDEKAIADAKAAEEAKLADANKNGSPRTYTEEEHQRAILAEKNRADESVKKSVAELELHKKNANLTQAEKDSLQKKIDELNSTVLTKDQLWKQDREKLISTNETEKKALSVERDQWKNRYVESTVHRALTDAASTLEAHQPEVFLALLGPKTEVVEEKDESGNTKGFKVKVKLKDIDPKTGQEVILDLDPMQAVKQLKDKPDTYGYLFKGHTNAGVGGTGSKELRPADYDRMTPEEYRKHREGLMR